jgi:hypothetical protein
MFRQHQDIPADSSDKVPYRSFLLATIENLEAGEMRFSAFCAHLNKSYGAKHVMHE